MSHPMMEMITSGKIDSETLYEYYGREIVRNTGIYVATLYFQSPAKRASQNGQPYLDHVQDPKYIRWASTPDPQYYNHAECLDDIRFYKYQAVLATLRRNDPLMYQPHSQPDQYSLHNGLCFWSIDRHAIYEFWAHCKAAYDARSPNKPTPFHVTWALHNWAATCRPELLSDRSGSIWRLGGSARASNARMVAAANRLLLSRLADPDRYGPSRDQGHVHSAPPPPPLLVLAPLEVPIPAPMQTGHIRSQWPSVATAAVTQGVSQRTRPAHLGSWRNATQTHGAGGSTMSALVPVPPQVRQRAMLSKDWRTPDRRPPQQQAAVSPGPPPPSMSPEIDRGVLLSSDTDISSYAALTSSMHGRGTLKTNQEALKDESTDHTSAVSSSSTTSASEVETEADNLSDASSSSTPPTSEGENEEEHDSGYASSAQDTEEEKDYTPDSESADPSSISPTRSSPQTSEGESDEKYDAGRASPALKSEPESKMKAEEKAATLDSNSISEPAGVAPSGWPRPATCETGAKSPEQQHEPVRPNPGQRQQQAEQNAAPLPPQPQFEPLFATQQALLDDWAEFDPEGHGVNFIPHY